MGNPIQLELKFGIEDYISYERELKEKKEKLNNKNIIKNISYNQKEILYNIMLLYNDGKPFDCDITASSLKFYEKKKTDDFIIPEPKYLFDVCPQFDRVNKIMPFKQIPLESNSIHSMVIDLPFVISPKTCKSMLKPPKEKSCIIANRFSSWYPYKEGYSNMYWWLKEAERVVEDGGIIVYKMQNTVSGGINHWYSMFSMLVAQKLGLYVIDQIILEAKARLIGTAKIKKQAHARKYTSDFWVFKKDTKNADKTSCFTLIDWCDNNVHEGMEWELK